LEQRPAAGRQIAVECGGLAMQVIRTASAREDAGAADARDERRRQAVDVHVGDPLQTVVGLQRALEVALLPAHARRPRQRAGANRRVRGVRQLEVLARRPGQVADGVFQFLRRCEVR
jgi:hypothetical protein